MALIVIDIINSDEESKQEITPSCHRCSSKQEDLRSLGDESLCHHCYNEQLSNIPNVTPQLEVYK